MRRSLALLTAILVPGLVGQSKTPAADWPMFNRDLASTRY